MLRTGAVPSISSLFESRHSAEPLPLPSSKAGRAAPLCRLFLSSSLGPSKQILADLIHIEIHCCLMTSDWYS